MKNLFFIAIILIISINYSFSQNSNKKINYYKVWVTQLDGINYKGFYLYSADKDGIVITGDHSSTELIYTIDYSKIMEIRMKRKGSIGKSALILGATGALVLGGVGFAAGDDPEDQWLYRFDKEDKAAYGAIVGGVLGAGFGALFGSIKEKMVINGDLENYMRHFPKLKSAQIKRE
jgi:hypothetical protein